MKVKKYLVDKTKPGIFGDNMELNFTKGTDILYIAFRDSRYVAWFEEREDKIEHKIALKNAEKAFNK